MRTGNCGVQQGLTAEAASVVKAAVSLAKRRGHAQVTPLHVANTMLSASNGLLRTACLQSHSHPLQCKALELCFNVALNRLPASNSSAPMPMLGPSPSHSHSHSPSISNALVAAFKRAQAHQRRGSIETQQQPLLAVKIELEQLIISILDDPSVSRVMREAGFSSTQVKSNVEQAVSLDICSQNTSATATTNTNTTPSPSPTSISNNLGKALDSVSVREEDVTSVVDYLIRNERSRMRRSTVVVGECVASLEGVVRAVMDKAERGELADDMRDVKFISFCLSAFGHVSRVEVEKRIEELRGLARSFHHNSKAKGLALYVGDLKWVLEYRSSRSTQHQGRGYYCPVEHVMREIGKLVNQGVNAADNNARFWVIGIATFQTYTRCQNGYPSLETLWGLHPFTVPAGSLALSLLADSTGVQKQSCNKKAENGTSWLLLEGREKEKQPDCFVAEPCAKFETQVRSLPTSTCNSDSSTSTLPAWLQQYKNESKGVICNVDQNCVPVGDLCKKWNSMCSSIQNQPCDPSVSPSYSSTSGFSYEQQHPNFWISGGGNSNSNTNTNDKSNHEPTLRMYIPEHKHTKPFPSSNPNSTSSSDVMETEEYVSKFKELNSENLTTLCDALETKVPWQKHIIPEIATTVLQCRSGMLRRKGNLINSSEKKQETWLFFQGVDMEGKEKIARELARLVFGSHRNLVCLGLSSFSSTPADSTEDSRNKRSRDEQSCSYIERFADAVSSNPHSVFLVEDTDQADYCSQLGFKRAMERGRLQDSNGEEVRLGDAIIILSCESFSSRSRASSPSIKQKSSCEQDKEHHVIASLDLEDTVSPCVSLDLNISINDDNDCEKDRSLHDNGLLESVDGRIIFNFQEL